MSDRERLTKWFDFTPTTQTPAPIPITGSFSNQLPIPIPSGTTALTIINQVVTLGTITLKHIHRDDRIYLTATVVSFNNSRTEREPQIQYQIVRDNVFVVMSVIDTNDDGGAFYTTSFTAAETNVPHGKHKYHLQAILLTPVDPTNSAANILIRNFSLEGTVLDENNT
ncbi:MULTISPECIES: hypothetical protein [unclassified Paenibacillus]|uniref:hypothetical protein n=1 Tax=unclassified Paenibacillus TaxID=185978 RepID=UPI00362D2450